MADTSIDFDSLLDDDDTFDAFELEQLDSLPPSTSFASASQRPPPAAAPPVARPPAQRPIPQPAPPSARRAGNAPLILRPPLPPSRLSASQTPSFSQAHAQSHAPLPPSRLAQPPAKRPRIVGAASGSAKQWTSPNPFHHRPPAQPLGRNPSLAVAPPPVVQQDEEEMPEITLVGEGGYEARAGPRGVEQGAGVGAGAGRDMGKLRAWGAGGSGSGSAARGAVGGAGDEELRRELEALRAEKAKLQATLLTAEQRAKVAETSLTSKQGEISIVRQRLKKSEDDHQLAILEEARVKAAMQEKLEKQEKEHRRAMESLKVEDAFRRQEVETSARRPNASSQWSSSARRRAGSQGPPGLMGPPPVPFGGGGSPSIGRGGRGGPAPAPTPKSFGGFKNAFEESPSSFFGPGGGGDSFSSSALPRRVDPPPGPLFGVGGKRKSPSKKGKNVMLVEEAVEEEMGGEEGMEVEMETERWDAGEEQEEEDLMGGNEGRDWRSEIISSIFTHTTYIHHDTESSTSFPPSHSSRTLGSTSSSRLLTHSTFSSTRYTHPHSHANSSTGRLALPESPSSTPSGPIPTFHALTNLRFPPHTPANITANYEELCRELFGILGRSSTSLGVGGGAGEEEAALQQHFLNPLAHTLESLATQLERAGIIGPLIQLLALIAQLILLFPGFTAYFLNASHTPTLNTPSKFLPLLSRLLRRFGRPPSPSSSRSSELASTPGGASLPSFLGKGKAKERSRRVRGVVMRPQQIMGGVKGKGAEGGYGEERVELEGLKRERLVGRVLECLEGLAWRGGVGVEEQFVLFLEAKDAVATLLDPNQPPAILISTIRFLSLLACRPSLFRHIVAVKFYDASDVRGSKVPIFDRVGSWLVRNGSKGPLHQIFALDACLISFITILSTKHTDAILFISSSSSLIPELLEKVFKDVRTVWEHDGKEVSRGTREGLKSIVSRLSSTVHLFYYLTCSPSSTLKINEFFTQSPFLGLHDRFTVAFGMLSFASLPDWAEEEEDQRMEGEGRKLVELGYLAQEIMEDVSPQEAEEMERCFATAAEDGMDAEGGGLAGADEAEELGGGAGGAGEAMVLDDDDEGDDEMLLRDLSQG
ncbi:hypothetical protein BCR35DRAFT_325508 [Leucosporidium creatinivorum]|uniref:Uncharacterized protein n=1 Tax=Leucosporidium creatinivorum TaxID=106004 RepID=A0A1Y2F2K1_9BASI|nr:hypothetical protein BCR35DRAFT_325508 [Leucosporidium creatinivorum]